MNATGPDAGLNVAIGEGPHVLDWQGFRWLNSEPGDQHKQLSRSSDGGHSWTHLPEPWVTPMAQGTRELDVGTPHQGPISLQGVRGDTPFYLYFTHVPLDPACVDCCRVRTSIATWYSWSIKLRAPLTENVPGFKTNVSHNRRRRYGRRTGLYSDVRPPKKSPLAFFSGLFKHTLHLQEYCVTPARPRSRCGRGPPPKHATACTKESNHRGRPPHGDTRHRAARGSVGRPQPC